MDMDDPLINTVGQAEDTEESLKMSQESVVLLQNHQQVLPLHSQKVVDELISNTNKVYNNARIRSETRTKS